MQKMTDKSIYRTISADIRGLLESGKLPSGTKVPSVVEIRNKYKVSHITALKALKTLALEKCIRFEKGKGYFACGKGVQQPHGLVACFTRPSWETNVRDNYFNDINQAVENELMKKAFSTLHPWCCHLLMNMFPSLEILDQIKRKILELDDSVDGFLLDERISDPVIEELKKKVSKPMVLVNRSSKAGVDSVTPDNSGGAKKAAEICMKLGYEKFIVGHNLQFSYNSEERTTVFISTLLKAGVPDNRIIRFGFNLKPYEEEFEPCEKHLDGPEKTLVFSPTDFFARWAADMLTARGLRLGKKIGVMGFDAMFVASLKKPFLATMDANPSKLGILAVNVLLGKINRTSTDGSANHSPEAIFKQGDTI